MAKIKQGFAAIFILTLFCSKGFAQYTVRYSPASADSAVLQSLALKSVFPSQAEARAYLGNLLPVLRTRGFIVASVDSVELDSSSAQVVVFLGEQYNGIKVRTLPENEAILEKIRWPFYSDRVDFPTLNVWQQRILDHLEENGRPFGRTYLDSIVINGKEVEAILRIDPGPLYTLDSIRVYGDVKLNKEFLEKYLELPAGSPYNAAKLRSVSKKLAELNFLQEDRPADLTRLATGSVLNLYLKPRRSSQVNALVGLLPGNRSGERKMLLTADANILLKNSLSSGETIGLVWQQLKQSSPRLNLLYEQPYIFHSVFGSAFSFDMYKQDSSFVNLNIRLGLNYTLASNQSASVFLLHRKTIVNGINAAAVIQTKRLPQEGDVSSLNLGFSYDLNNTDYRFNPKRGSVLSVVSSGGNKNIRKNSQVLELKDPANPSFNFENLYDTVRQHVYQFRINASAAHYLPLGRQSAIKLGINAGIYQSPYYFRNELFQIGGYKLLRGFNEESQYVSRYSVATAEFRYIIGLNSAFFAFADAGWGKHVLEMKGNHQYIGTGLGLSFETKAGIINLAWALGKRDDTEWNLRQSKIHLGFASYF
jgi:outer membrane protein assembly factor BamA